MVAEKGVCVSRQRPECGMRAGIQQIIRGAAHRIALGAAWADAGHALVRLPSRV